MDALCGGCALLALELFFEDRARWCIILCHIRQPSRRRFLRFSFVPSYTRGGIRDGQVSATRFLLKITIQRDAQIGILRKPWFFNSAQSCSPHSVSTSLSPQRVTSCVHKNLTGTGGLPCGLQLLPRSNPVQIQKVSELVYVTDHSNCPPETMRQKVVFCREGGVGCCFRAWLSSIVAPTSDVTRC